MQMLKNDIITLARKDWSFPVAAKIRPRYGGDGLIGLEMYSGWYWTAT